MHNCTASNETVNFVYARGIGVFQTSRGGLFSVIACTWTVLHRNVPEQWNGRDPGFWGRLEMDAKKSAQKHKIGESQHCCSRMDLKVSYMVSGGCHLLSQHIQTFSYSRWCRMNPYTWISCQYGRFCNEGHIVSRRCFDARCDFSTSQENQLLNLRRKTISRGCHKLTLSI